MSTTTSPPPAPQQAPTGDAGITTTLMHPEIEADSSDLDSSFTDSEAESYTTSLASSVFDYQYENGRRYHRFREGQYFLPNDETEQDRLDMHHHMLTVIQGGQLHGAPLDKPQKVLDLGTGTGIWAIEMGDAYPSAHVTGNDLSPIQPNWVPPNVEFLVDDIESEWTYPENSFDFIYCRYLLGGISDWPRLIKQAYKALKPGGYLELLEPDSNMLCDDNSISPDAPLWKWNELFLEAGEKAGRSLVEAPNHKKSMQEAGFVEIQEDIFKLPNSPWPKDKHLKEVGAFHMASFLEALEGLSLRFFQAFHGMKAEEIQVMLVNVRKDLKNRRYHTYYHLHRIYAQGVTTALHNLGKRQGQGDVAENSFMPLVD
ncbi:hypothetical protein H072_4283 [Dactylellina haptotyla CBS 200.50]|uniref:Methyltransferase domain-containing protein n=1 Tax=Dactylellina haptotyla (strain CBS 200.50) TaxID=1284197 RepID=S8BQR3_DACHA|nr:hypothetical protein H072_4283 [Dactylellina haptotyla CBS 200.50]